MQYAILPEHRVPDFSAGCAKCELGCHRSRMIWGEGQPGAPLLVLLDNPGAREDRRGVPFLCGTRRTLQELAVQAGIGLEEMYITFVVKCRPTKAYDKKQARTTCLDYFHWQIAEHRPQVLFALGNVSIHALLHDESAEVKTMRCHWHNWSGIPLAVSYHPLAVRRRPGLFRFALQDWIMVTRQIKRNE